MTMSVGLARIINDPSASVIVRKALGALSTPGLLVHDTGLSIDSAGRIILKLKTDGGLLQDENGLHLEVTVGVDSHVDLDSEEYDRDWNARLTGTAPNFIEGSVAIGTEELDGKPLTGFNVEKAKLSVTSTRTQLRLSHDPANFMAVRVLSSGFQEQFSAGSEPGFHFISSTDTSKEMVSGGIRINYGTTIEQIFSFYGVVPIWNGFGTVGVTSNYDFTFDTTAIKPEGFTVRLDQDFVSVTPDAGASGIPAMWLGWSARVSASNEVTVRVSWFDVWPASPPFYFRFLIHKLS